MEDKQMNIYDEMLNKYAAFLGYEGKIKADENHIMKEIEKLKIVLMVNDDLDNIKKSYEKSKNKLRRTIFVGYNNGSAYITEGKAVLPDTNLNMIAINRVYEDKEPCICFVIDEQNNSYEEISIDEVMNILS